MLYTFFRDEKELFPESPEKFQELFEIKLKDICQVRSQVMPFLVEVAEAREKYTSDEMSRREHDETTGEQFDPEMEKEYEDLEDIIEEDHPSYIHPVLPARILTNLREKYAKSEGFRRFFLVKIGGKLEYFF